MVNMTTAEFISALGTKVTTITYDTTQSEGVTLSSDELTANVYNVAISGTFSDTSHMPDTLVTADLRGLDVSTMTDLSYMFYSCKVLESLDITNFDTSNVTSLQYMFGACWQIGAKSPLDLSSFDTSKVSTTTTPTIFTEMYNCKFIVNLSKWTLGTPEYFFGAAYSTIYTKATTVTADEFVTTSGEKLTDKANKATTLAGYGITDALTAAETKALADLENYYLKSETYTQEEINSKISVIPKFSILPVDELPTENISTTTIYLLKDSEEESGNLYTEYIYVNEKWEILGSQKAEVVGVTSITKAEYLAKKEEYDASGNFILLTDVGEKYTYADSEITSDAIDGDSTVKEALVDLDTNKVDKEDGKGLSTNDYTTAEKTKLAGIAEGATKVTVDSEMSDTSENPVQNKVVTESVTEINNNIWLEFDNPDATLTGSSSLKKASGDYYVDLGSGVNAVGKVLYIANNITFTPFNYSITLKQGYYYAKTFALLYNGFSVVHDGSNICTGESNDYYLYSTTPKFPINDICNLKMNTSNPTGTGSFSLNRKSGTTVGDYSFAEGQYTTASGGSSHAEGYRTIASGSVSHAEGNTTTASGYYSHAEGNNTLASSNNQHVQGQYNVEDTTNTYAHIVGGGTSTTDRKNIHTLDWSGNAVFAGDVTATDTDGNSVSLTTVNNNIPKLEDISSLFTVVVSGIWLYAYKYGKFICLSVNARSNSVSANSSLKVATFDSSIAPLSIGCANYSFKCSNRTETGVMIASDGIYLENNTSSAAQYIQGSGIYPIH